LAFYSAKKEKNNNNKGATITKEKATGAIDRRTVCLPLLSKRRVAASASVAVAVAVNVILFLHLLKQRRTV